MSLFLATRRNHALEHATLHVLARDWPQRPLAGYSYPGGIFILGDVPTPLLLAALHEAEMRLRRGEHQLAIHPGCGTNLSLSLFLAAGLAWMPLRGLSVSRRWLRLPLAVILALFGLLLARPLGPWAQVHLTTAAELGELRVAEVTCLTSVPFTIHHIRTRHG